MISFVFSSSIINESHILISDFTEMLEFLHLLTANNRIVFSSVNNNGEFIASLCYHLLIMTGATLPEYSNHDDGHDSESAAGRVQMFHTDLADFGWEK
jgi:hypothetical protein